MKRICISLMALTVGIASAQNATEYLNIIGNEFLEIQKNTWDYTSSAAHGKSARKIEQRRRDVVTSNRDAIRKISRMKAFNGSTGLRDSALSFLKVNFAVLNEDYAKLVDLEEISEQSYDAMEAYMLARERANEKLRVAGDIMESEYAGFAREHQITLREDNRKVTDNLEVAGKVYSHYNEVYLIFFKSYKQEAYLLDAMNRNDVNGIEQNRNALATVSAEGRQKLKTLQPYKGDASLIKACDEMLEFYSDESSENKGLAAYFVAKDNFEKIKKSFEDRPASQHTGTDVDKFNNAVNEFNRENDRFNSVNETMNKRRSSLINTWNSACDKFTDRHVPKR
jgi:hypothetical protein